MASILASTPSFTAAPVRASASPLPPSSSRVCLVPSSGGLRLRSIAQRHALKASQQDFLEGAKDKSSDVQKGLEEAAEGVKETLSGIQDSITDSIDNIKDSAKDVNWPNPGKDSSEAADRVKEGAEDVRGRAEETRDSIGDKIQDAVDKLKGEFQGMGADWGSMVLRTSAALVLAMGIVVASPAPGSLALSPEEQGVRDSLKSATGPFEAGRKGLEALANSPGSDVQRSIAEEQVEQAKFTGQSSPKEDVFTQSRSAQGPIKALEGVRGGLESAGDKLVDNAKGKGLFSYLPSSSYGPVASIVGDVKKGLGDANDSIQDNIKGAAESVGGSAPLEGIKENIKEAQEEGRKGSGSLRDWAGKDPQSRADAEESYAPSSSAAASSIKGVGEDLSGKKDEAGGFLSSKAAELKDTIKSGVSSVGTSPAYTVASAELAQQTSSAAQSVGQDVQGKSNEVGDALKGFFGGKQDELKGKAEDVKGSLQGNVGDQIKGKADQVKGSFQGDVGEQVKGQVDEAKGALQGNLGDQIKGKADQVKGAIQGGLSTTDLGASSFGDQVKGKAEEVQGSLQGNLGDQIRGKADEIKGSFQGNVGDQVKGQADQVKGSLQGNVGDQVKGKADQLKGSVQGNNLGEQLKGKANEVKGAIQGGLSSTDIASNAAENISGFGDSLRQSAENNVDKVQGNVGKPLESLNKSAEGALSEPKNVFQKVFQGVSEVGKGGADNLPEEERRFRAEGSGAERGAFREGTELSRSMEGYNP